MATINKSVRPWFHALLPVAAFSVASSWALAQAPAFVLQGNEFARGGSGVSTIAWRSDSEGGLDITPTPCGGRYVLSFADGKASPFNQQSVHTFLHKVELFGYVFDSDNLDPLVFRVSPDGYAWVRGRGTVKVPRGAPVLARDLTLLADEQTFLLPPGNSDPVLPPPPPVGPGRKFAVCGNNLQIVSANRSEGITLTFVLNPPVPAADASNRVAISLLDQDGHRFKPRGDEAVTWGTVGRKEGIEFEIPAEAIPVLLEVEGIQFDIRSLRLGAVGTGRQ